MRHVKPRASTQEQQLLCAPGSVSCAQQGVEQVVWVLGCRGRMPNLITHSGYQWLGACETAEKVVFSSHYLADEGCTEHGVSGASPGLAMGPAAGAEVGLLCTCVIWKRNTCTSSVCSYFMRCCLASGAPAVSLQGRFCRFWLGSWEALGMV